MQELRVGVVGFGFMGKTHTLAYQTIPLFYENPPFRIHLRGVCAAHLEKAQAAQAAHGFAYATDDARRIFADREIDCVSICLPTGLHGPAVEQALAAGKHVYCDKPLAANYAQARHLAQLEHEGEIVKYKALLELLYDPTLEECIRQAGKLDQYLFYDDCRNPHELGLRLFAQQCRLDFDEEEIQTINFALYGRMMLSRTGVVETSYGYIVPRREQFPE